MRKNIDFMEYQTPKNYNLPFRLIDNKEEKNIFLEKKTSKMTI